MLNPSVLDPVFYEHRDKLKGFAYITDQLSRFTDAKVKKLEMSDSARINLQDVGVYGVLPSIFDSTVTDFLKLDYDQSVLLSGLPLGEQLYTPRGS